MKQIIISTIIGCFIVTGFSQIQITESKKIDSQQNVLKMKPVQVDIDTHRDTQRSSENIKGESPFLPQGKLKFVRHAEKTNKKSKYPAETNVKPKQILTMERSTDFLNSRERIYSKTRTPKRLGRVEGYVERVEIKKIEGHAPLNQELLIRALGNPKLIKIQFDKTK